MSINYSDATLKKKWEEFWAAQGISWDDTPAFPTRRNTIKKFKKLVKQQEEEQEYSKYFINTFLAAL